AGVPRRRTRWPTSSSHGGGRSTCRPSSTASPRPCRSTVPTMPSEPEEKPMTLNEILLQKLAEWRPATRQTLTAAEAGWNVAVSADRCDELGCLVWEVTLARTAPAEAATPLRAWAERV